MDPLPETRTRFQNNGPAASRRRFWTRGDGFDGPSRIERSIHSTGIVVPLPTHYRKDAHSACRDEFRKYRQIRRRFGAANGKAGCAVVHPSERLQLQHRNCSFPEIAAVEIVCSRASTFRMRPMMLKPHCWTVPARFRRASKTRRHSPAMRLEHHWTHSECRCTRTYDFNGRDFRERTISMLKLKPFRRVDHCASCFSIRSTKAAADLTIFSELITTSTVGVFSIVRWKRNHDTSGMDRTFDAGRSVKSITTRPKPPP